MKLNRPAAAVIGLLTLVPYAWSLVLVIYFLPNLMSAGRPGGATTADYFHVFDLAWTVSVAMMVAVVVLVAGFVVHLLRSGAVPQPQRGVWAAMLILLGFLVLPVYWYRYIWQASSPGAA